MNRFGLLLVLILSRIATAAPLPIAEVYKSAKIGEKVEIQGTVTAKGEWHVILHDRTAGILVYDTYRKDFAETGDVIRVHATVEMGDRVKRVRITSHEKIGQDFELARPVPISIETARNTSDLDYRAVSVGGTVVDAFRDELDPAWICLCLAPLKMPLTVMIYDSDDDLGDASQFIDAEINVIGTLSSFTKSRSYLSRYVSTFSASNLTVISPPPSDPFAVKELPCDRVTSTYLIDNDGHRRRITGRVLATWDRNCIFLQPTKGNPVRVRLRPDGALPPVGSRVTVSGFPLQSVFFAKIVNAVWRNESGEPSRWSEPLDINPHDLLADNLNQKKLQYSTDGQLIRVKGRLVSISRQNATQSAMFLDCGMETVKIDTPATTLPAVGAVLEVTGVCKFDEDPDTESTGIVRLKGFTLLPRSTEDIRIIRNPPWWTPAKVISAAAILLALLLAGLVWNFILQKLVARKGRELARESLAHLKAELRVDERTGLAVELHDTIAQNLTGVSMQMEGVAEAHRIGSPRLGELIGKARHALDSCRTELRNCLWDLRNDAFDSDDISAIIRKAIAPHLGSASADVKLDLQRSHISDSTFHALLCIIRELVINAVRHGAATQIDIRGEMTETALKITVRDNGRGFDPTSRPGPDEGHFGLLGIQERLDRLGGTLDINSTPGHGAEFTISVES